MKQKRYLGFFLGIILILTPLSHAAYTAFDNQPLHTISQTKHNPSEQPINSNSVRILLYSLDKNGNFNTDMKTIAKETYQRFIKEISNIEISEGNMIAFLEEKLNIMKQYQLITQNITLQNLIDISPYTEFLSLPFNLTHAKSFQSNFAPLFIVGMGFGLGLGYRRMPVYQRIAGNLFSAGLIGLGAIVCFDIAAKSIYYQYTFTFPYLIHVLSGFIGIMLFAYDNIFPVQPGPPVTLYSNFLAIGMAGLAIGFEFPSTYS